MLGETTIHTQELIIKENTASELSFEIPHLLPAESEVINDHDKIITKNWNRIKKKEKSKKKLLMSLIHYLPIKTTIFPCLILKMNTKVRKAEWEAKHSGTQQKR